MRCVVTGATGYVGGRLVPLLLERGHTVRATARRPSRLSNVSWRDDAEVARGDVGDVDSLFTAFDGADVVYCLVPLDESAANNIVTAARRAGVKRLVYLSGFHPSDAKLILLASGIDTLVLQAGVIVGAGSAPFEMIRHLTDRLPLMTMPKWVHSKIQPIALRDALHYLVEAAAAAVPESRAWDIGGPDVLEYGEMMQIYADVAGLHRRVIVALPLLTPAVASRWVGLVTSIPFRLTRPLVESLQCDAVMDNRDIDRIIAPPGDGLTGYRKSVSLALKPIAEGTDEKRLPTDPDWAGAVGYTIKRSGWTPVTEEELWQIVESSPAQRDWQVKLHEPGRLLLLRKNARIPGDAWLRMRVGSVSGGGSAYHQREVFYPKGIPGRIYWYGGLRLHRKRFRALFRDVMDRAR